MTTTTTRRNDRGGNTKLEARNNYEAQMTNRNYRDGFVIDYFNIPSSFGFRASKFRRSGGFTVIELLVVIAIIIVLAGLILATTGYVQKKGARSRAESEIAAIPAACESYKADNGIYPNSANTNTLAANASVDNNPAFGAYANATLDLYEKLTGDTIHDGSASSSKNYIAFKPQMLGRANRGLPVSSSNKVTSLMDPFGNSYGYSTSKNPDANPNASTAQGYNPTFDLWSTSGTTTNNASDLSQWIKNW